MNTPIEAIGRDPVAIALESLLCEMESNGMGTIRQQSTQCSVVVSFDDMVGKGQTLDIALVQLANAMMDDEKYTRLIMDALRAPMQSAEAQVG